MKKVAKKKAEETIDYQKYAMNAAKVVVPIIALKLLHNKYKSSKAKPSTWESTLEHLISEVKDKISKL